MTDTVDIVTDFRPLRTRSDLQQELRAKIDGVKILGLTASISIDGRIVHTLGATGNGTLATSPMELSDTYDCSVSVWYSSGSTREARRVIDDTHAQVSDWWQTSARSVKTELLNLDSIRPQLELTMDVWAESSPVALIYCDIDHFKVVNDEKDHQAGDRVIRDLGHIIEQTCPAEGIAVHRSGDEFIIALPAPTRVRALVTASRFFETANLAFQDTVPKDLSQQVSLSMGLAIESQEINLSLLERRAESALKAGGKARNQLSVEPTAGADVASSTPTFQECKIDAYAGLDSQAPFASDWLNMLSLAVATSGGTRDAIAHAFDTAKQVRVLATADPPVEITEPPSDQISLAIAHGLARSTDTSGQVSVAAGNEIEVHWSMREGSEYQYRLGPWEPEARFDLALPHALEEDFDTKPLLVVQYGESNPIGTPSLSRATQALVYVDDRPSVGGGLPDFWEGAIAEIVVQLNNHPNVSDVIVVGSLEPVPSTLSWIQDAPNWGSSETLDLLVAKTGLSTTRILSASMRLAEHWHTPSTTQQALEIAEEGLRQRTEVIARPEQGNSFTPSVRRALLDEPVLPPEEGCKVSTASMAYPIALERIRTHRALHTDQISRVFTEIPDFRIVLTTPSVNPVPSYYENDKGRMEEYFQREFMDKSGKFRRVLDLEGQLDRVKSYLKQVLVSHSFSTRRAILVVPNLPMGPEDVAPLGLVAIRVFPRFQAGRTVLDFSYSWRTVEALIGLPFSLFGSIRFAEEMVKELAEEVTHDNVSLGTLSYIAHSFHLYTTDYGLEMARLIVNAASS